jgi:TrpR-related protein YerC/YecD
MRIKRRFTEDSYRREPWFKAIVSAIQSCKTEETLTDFLRDIGTLSELQEWSERLEVAKLLSQGMSYRKVASQTGASTTTVTRVAKYLENGEGGYRSVLHTHRHHRMQASIRDTDSARADERKSEQISVLQKYLDRRFSSDANK